MDRKQFRTALLEALAVSDNVEVLEEAVGKASFGNLLDDEVITKIGKALKREGISASELNFKKVAPKSYSFSIAKKRFIKKNNNEGLGDKAPVVVFVNKETKEYMAFLIEDFDLRREGNKHVLLTSNIKGFVFNYNVSIGKRYIFSNEDFLFIQNFVKNTNVVTFEAMVTNENVSNTSDKKLQRIVNKSVYDDMQERTKEYQDKVKNHLYDKRPVYKKLKELLESCYKIVWAIHALDNEDGTYSIVFNIADLNHNLEIKAFEKSKDLNGKIFKEFKVSEVFVNGKYPIDILDRLVRYKKAIEYMTDITVKDILIKKEDLPEFI